MGNADLLSQWTDLLPKGMHRRNGTTRSPTLLPLPGRNTLSSRTALSSPLTILPPAMKRKRRHLPGTWPCSMRLPRCPASTGRTTGKPALCAVSRGMLSPKGMHRKAADYGNAHRKKHLRPLRCMASHIRPDMVYRRDNSARRAGIFIPLFSQTGKLSGAGRARQPVLFSHLAQPGERLRKGPRPASSDAGVRAV